FRPATHDASNRATGSGTELRRSRAWPRMKPGFSRPLLLFIACLLLPAIRGAAETPGISLEEYRQQLRELSAKVDSLNEHPEQASAVASSIPDTVTVRTGSKPILVSYRDLKDDLAAISRGDPQKRSAMLPRVQSYLHELKEEAGIHEADSEMPAARQKLAY